jgi:energy-coupling factor transport system permease protein
LASYLIEGFIFRHSDSIVLRRDPRIKLLLAAFLIVIALLSDRPYGAVATLAFLLATAFIARVMGRMARLTIFTVPFAVIIFVINYLVGVGVMASATEAAWFVNIIIAASMFFITTSPDELEYIMRWVKLPRDFTFVFVTAVRFVPVLMLDFYSIADAQKSRGLQVDVKNPIKWVRNLVPILIPLMVNSLMRSEQMAEAMEARGYGSVDVTTSMYRLQLNSGDYIMAGLTLLICSAMICFLLIL